MSLLDTSVKKEDITRTFIADLVLQLLAYFAQTECEAINRRQKEGIAAAKNRGVVFGRPKEEKPEGYEEVLKAWRDGKMSAREAGKRIGVSHQTFLRWARKG